MVSYAPTRVPDVGDMDGIVAVFQLLFALRQRFQHGELEPIRVR